MAEQFNVEAAVDNYLANTAPQAKPTMQATMAQAVGQNPDTQAELARIAARTGVPIGAVASNLDDVKRQDALGQIDFPGYEAMNPVSAEALSDPDFAGVAHDDITTLGSIEQALKRTLPGMAIADAIAPNLSAGVKERTVQVGAGLVRAGKTVDTAIAKQLFPELADFAYGAKPLTLPGEQGLRSLEKVSFGYQPSTTWDDVKNSPFTDFLPWAFETGVLSAPDMAAAIFTPLAYIVSQTGEISRNRSENDGRMQPNLEDMLLAAPAAVANTYLERLGVENIIPKKLALEGMAALTAKRALIEGAKDTGKAALKEGFYEGAQNAIQNVSETAGTAKGFSLGDFADQTLQGAVAGFGFGGMVHGGGTAAHQIAVRGEKEMKKVRAADTAAQTLENLTEYSNSSKLRERDPVAFQNFVQKAAEKGGVENIYLDPRALMQAGIDPAKLAEISPSIAAQIEESTTTGSDIVIPTSEFATHIAPSEFGQSLIDHLRTDPDGMSRAEAQEFMQTQGPKLEADIQKNAEKVTLDDSIRQSQSKVEEALSAQLQGTQRFTGTVNKAYSAVLANFFTVHGARQGITPEEAYARSGLKIQADTTPKGFFHGMVERFTPKPSIVDKDGNVQLTHYSRTPGLVTADPSYWGSTQQALTREERTRQMTGAPGRTYFGTATYKKEPQLGDYKYSATVSAKDLYDADKDRLSLRQKAAEQVASGVEADPTTAFEKLVIANGFKGALMETKRNGAAVAIYTPLPIQYVDEKSMLAPLEGAPKEQQAPTPQAREAAYQYMESKGLIYQPPTTFAALDLARAARIATAFGDMAHAPEDPQVKAAYQAMIDETMDQYQQIKKTGLAIDMIAKGQEDPYAESPRLATKDVQENNHLWVYPTDLGFGTETTITDNPLYELVDEYIGDRQLRANDVFRIVHDYFGHVKDGTGFRAAGEENAWQSHAAMFTPLARRAMTTETRGQNSYVNYGPHGEFNRTAAAGETIYADQKIGLLPEWVSEEGFIGGKDTGKPSAVFNQSLAENDSDSISSIATLGFRSKMYDVLAQKLNGTGTPEQMRQQVESMIKKGEFKAEEYFWSGLQEALESNRNTKLTKQEVLDTVRNGYKLELEEVGESEGAGSTSQASEEFTQDAFSEQDMIYDEPDSSRIEEIARDDYYDDILKEMQDDNAELEEEDQLTDAQLEEKAMEKAIQYAEDSHREDEYNYSSSSTNTVVLNGTRYELEYRRSEWGGEVLVNGQYIDEASDWPQALRIMRDNVGAQSGMTISEDDAPEFADWTSDGGTNYSFYRVRADSLGRRDQPGNGHYNDTNVLFHYRTKDRTGPNGEKMLFIEEIQSDLHHSALETRQEAGGTGYRDQAMEDKLAEAMDARNDADHLRSQGVSNREALYREVEAELRDASAEDEVRVTQAMRWIKGATTEEGNLDISKLPEDAPESAKLAAKVWPKFSEALRAAQAQIAPAQAAYYDAVNKISALEKAPVPAPLAKTWREAALKRLLAKAADEGYQSVGWTIGAQQNVRYNIGSLVGGMQARFNTDGTYDLQPDETRVANAIREALGIDKEQNRNILGLTADQLNKSLGTQGAASIIAQAQTAGEISYVDFEKDIEIGGEGKRKLYDEIIPQEAKKVMKKLDPEMKVELTDYSITEKNGKYKFDKIWYAPLTDRAKASAKTGQELFQKNSADAAAQPVVTRGSYNPETRTITLMKAADLSTMLHESAHFFLDIMADAASQPNASPEIQNDLRIFFEWAGIGGLAHWNSLGLEGQRNAHEMFARGFEAYLFEGKAPSIELQGLFQRFRSWMLRIYKSIKNLNIEITPEIRGVFDRMLATADQIQEAESMRQMESLYGSMADSGMTSEEYIAYQKLGIQASQDAVTALEARSLRDMKWLSGARGRELKRLQKEAQARRAEIKAEVMKEVYGEPVNMAATFLKRGTIAGDQQKGATKFSLPEIEAMYGDNPIIGAIKQTLGTGKYGMLSRDNGIHPEQVAEMFGFSSGDELIRSLLGREDPKAKIDGVTDQRMLERYGDLTDADAMERAADKAVHNEARAKFIATELDALNKAQGGTTVRKMSREAAQAFAANAIARLKIMDLKPARFAAAEGRAALASTKALKAGDLELAAAEKRNQLLNNYSAKEAFAAQDEVEKVLRYLKKFDRAGSRKKIDVAYLDQIDAILDRFDLRASTTLKSIKKKESLQKWVEGQIEQGLEPDIDPAILDETNRKSYKEMTVEELRGLNDSIRQIDHLGRLKNKLLTAKDNKEFDATVAEIVASINKYADGKTADNRTRAGVEENLRLFKGFIASHRKVASIVKELDGFNDGGPLWNTLIRTMNEAGDKEAGMREKATKKLAKLVAPILKDGKLGGKGKFFDSVGKSLNREEIIGIALNTGNEGNLQRLLDGEGWTLEQLHPVLDTLSKADWDFVQDVWDMFESYRPLIGAKEKRVYGREPAWIEPKAVTTKHGEYRGGYYPVKYDPARSQQAEQFDDAEAAKQQMKGAFTSATTRRSFTKARADEVKGRPLLYSMGGLYQGLNEVIHDLAWHEWLIDANRLMRSRSLDGAIRNQYGKDFVKQIKDSITDIAGGEMSRDGAFAAGLNRLRVGAMVSGIGFNIMNSAINVTGVTQSFHRIGPKYMAIGIGEWAKNPRALTAKVQGMSEFMRLRANTMNRELNEIQSMVRGKSKPREIMDKIMFLPMTVTQIAVDTPTWWGAYQKAMTEQSDEAKGIAMADQAVLDAQGGGQIKDLAAIQRGGAFQKLWTTFYGYFSTTYNLMAESKNKTNFKDPMDVLRYGTDMLMLSVVPAFLGTILKTTLMGGDDDWEPETLAKHLANDQISYLFGTVVGLRELQGAVQKVFNVNTFASGYGGPASLRFFQEMDKMASQISQGEVDDALIKSVINVAGIMFRLPSGQINRTIFGTKALVEGDTSNPAAVLAGPPPK